MKICFIMGVITAHMKNWTEWFADNGHEVHIILTSPIKSPITVKKNIQLHRVNPDDWHFLIKILPFKSKWAYLLLYRELIKEIDPDIVHGQDITVTGLPTAFSGNYPKAVSAWGSDVLIHPKKSKKIMLWMKYVLKRADLIHSFADSLTDALISLGADKEKTATIPPGADTETFNLDADGSKIRKSLGWENNPIVISTRSFRPVYNIECLINAIPIVIKELPDAKFIIKGMDYIGSLENKLKNMVEELGISDNVKFIGFVEYEELPEYLAAADVYVSTALSEGCGISNLEAISCGVPVILGDIPTSRNIIKEGLKITLFPVKNSNVLAEKIIHLIKNKPSKEVRKENSRIVNEKFSWNTQMKKVEKLYEDLIEKHKK